MIKLSNSLGQSNQHEYYLSPGDIFISKKENRRSGVINKYPTANPGAISNDSLSTRILPLERDKDDRYEFNNYPLDVVFDQLQVIYNTKIVYDKGELGNRTFIGKIDKKDSLYHILKSITLLTNFNLRQQADSFIISPAIPH